ncbi:hypothetical protein HK104_006111 [Borealophlyctis nickersoniae]|nr:hypothetical protein HK104_006111 [Borealophlyctis nickersoniae]
MANRTATDAHTVHGTNPQFLIEKIIRTRIWDSIYWKQECFALTAETLIDKAVNLKCIGGQYGNQRPTEFLCLALKMLQLQPEKDIIKLYIQNEDYKYLRALGAFYLRLTGSAKEIYQYLEPLLADYRKLRRRLNNGSFDIVCMDEFIDDLLRGERVCDTILPRITQRHVLEDNDELPARRSMLEDELEEEEILDDGEEKERSRSRRREGIGASVGGEVAVEAGAWGGQMRDVPTGRESEETGTDGHIVTATILVAVQIHGRDPHVVTGVGIVTEIVQEIAIEAGRRISHETALWTAGVMTGIGAETEAETGGTEIAVETGVGIAAETGGTAAETGAETAAETAGPGAPAETGAETAAETPGPGAPAETGVGIEAEIGLPTEGGTGVGTETAAARVTTVPFHPIMKMANMFKKKGSEGRDVGGSVGAKEESGVGGGDNSSMSIEETNKLRASLGLKPLKL